MRTPSSTVALALLCLSLAGCPEKKEQPTSHTGKEYKTASEGFKDVIPNTANLPNQKALDNIKNTMEQTDKSQDRYEQKAAAAAEKE